MRRPFLRATLGIALVGMGTLSAAAQQLSALPDWLKSYPGTSAPVQASGSTLESTYTAAGAHLDDVTGHYRKIFEALGVAFRSNPDGIGVTMNASAHACDLLIQIREQSAGTLVHVYCSVPDNTPAQPAPEPRIIRQSNASRPDAKRAAAPATPTPRVEIPADVMARHRQLAAEMGIGRQHPDAPAPPLVWPPWLTHLRGAALHVVQDTDRSGDQTLTARYDTNVPMTEIRNFYRDLLASHGYPGRVQLSTGHTLSGVQQNAFGLVDGSNYPDGAPGASTEIEVQFQRSVLNGPITVTMRFTTRAYVAKRGY